MGMRFRKSKQIAPGVKLNVTKKGFGVSFGGEVGGISVNSQGDATKRASIPGTGISFVNRKRKKQASISTAARIAEV